MLKATEAKIIQKIAEGDRKAFEELYVNYFGMIQYFIVKNSGNEQDAEDVFQKVMLVFYEKCCNPHFKLTCALKTYLYSIARNLWLKELQKRKRNDTAISDREKFVNIVFEENNQATDEKASGLQKAISLLGENCQKLLVHFYFLKQSMDSIAIKMGYTSAANAKNQKYKCIQQLKKRLLS